MTRHPNHQFRPEHGKDANSETSKGAIDES